jgi:hypothetical protein
MQALTEMTAAHPMASLWVAITIVLWIVIQTKTAGGRRRRAPPPRRPIAPDSPAHRAKMTAIATPRLSA